MRRKSLFFYFPILIVFSISINLMFQTITVSAADIEEEISTKKTFIQSFKNYFHKNSKKVTIDNLNLSTKEQSWFFKPNSEGKSPEEPQAVIDLISKYKGYYLGDTSKKFLYLTFDEGYENGYTSQILDVLKANNVKAAFFVTTPYVKTNKDIILRMVKEGHLVCNHSHSHPSMAKIQDREKFTEELTKVENAFEEITGTKMPKYFRPPMGRYSELSLYYTASLGYKTIFWSFAYEDWIPTKQPSKEYATKKIMDRTHNGGIVLLHAVSKTNSDIMDSIIKEWKSKGFEFKTLNDLP